jgi:hypothetical protein
LVFGVQIGIASGNPDQERGNSSVLFLQNLAGETEQQIKISK